MSLEVLPSLEELIRTKNPRAKIPKGSDYLRPVDLTRIMVIGGGKLLYDIKQWPEIRVISFDVGGVITQNTEILVYKTIGVKNDDAKLYRRRFHLGEIGIDEYADALRNQAWRDKSRISKELLELRTNLSISPGKKPSRNIVKNLLLMFSTPIEQMLDFIKKIRSYYSNIILGVASNQGLEIAKILSGKLKGYFDFQVYSCEVEKLKYHDEFWNDVLENANGVARRRGIIGFENIVHIDDHIGKINALIYKGGFGIRYEHLEPIKLLEEAINSYLSKNNASLL